MPGPAVEIRTPPARCHGSSTQARAGVRTERPGHLAPTGPRHHDRDQPLRRRGRDQLGGHGPDIHRSASRDCWRGLSGAWYVEALHDARSTITERVDRCVVAGDSLPAWMRSPSYVPRKCK